MQWGIIGDVLGTYWGRHSIGDASEMHLRRIGDTLEMHWWCNGDVFGTYWGCYSIGDASEVHLGRFGDELGAYWGRIGDATALWTHQRCICEALGRNLRRSFGAIRGFSVLFIPLIECFGLFFKDCQFWMASFYHCDHCITFASKKTKLWGVF